MTGNTKRFATIAATLLIALPLSAGIASAESTRGDQTRIVALDATPTGSIQRAEAIRNCDPDGPGATAICKITGGDPNAKFPSAPVSSFGF